MVVSAVSERASSYLDRLLCGGWQKQLFDAEAPRLFPKQVLNGIDSSVDWQEIIQQQWQNEAQPSAAIGVLVETQSKTKDKQDEELLRNAAKGFTESMEALQAKALRSSASSKLRPLLPQTRASACSPALHSLAHGATQHRQFLDSLAQVQANLEAEQPQGDESAPLAEYTDEMAQALELLIDAKP